MKTVTRYPSCPENRLIESCFHSIVLSLSLTFLSGLFLFTFMCVCTIVRILSKATFQRANSSLLTISSPLKFLNCSFYSIITASHSLWLILAFAFFFSFFMWTSKSPSPLISWVTLGTLSEASQTSVFPPGSQG